MHTVKDRIIFTNAEKLAKARRSKPGKLLKLELECPACAKGKETYLMRPQAFRLARLKFATVIFHCGNCKNNLTVTKIPVKICKTCKTDLTFK